MVSMNNPPKTELGDVADDGTVYVVFELSVGTASKYVPSASASALGHTRNNAGSDPSVCGSATTRWGLDTQTSTTYAKKENPSGPESSPARSTNSAPQSMGSMRRAPSEHSSGGGSASVKKELKLELADDDDADEAPEMCT